MLKRRTATGIAVLAATAGMSMGALAALPAVQQVGVLQFFGVQQFFVTLAPHSPEGAAAVEAVIRGVTDTLHPEIATKVTWRVLAPGERLPSSAIDYTRPA